MLQQHPVSEAIFNFAGAFSFLMLPLFIYDSKGKRKVSMWTAILVRANISGVCCKLVKPACSCNNEDLEMELIVRKQVSLVSYMI